MGKSRRSEPGREPIYTIPLRHPINTYGEGEEIADLNFYRRANLGDLRAAERQADGDIAITTVLLMRLCELTAKEVEAIDLVDMAPISLFLEYLTGEGPDPRLANEKVADPDTPIPPSVDT